MSVQTAEAKPASAGHWTVEAVGVEKSFHVGGARSEEGAASTVPALRGAGLQVAGGEFVAIVGRSGCGKSTFLNILGGLDRPSGGSVRVGGQDLATLSERDLTRYRRDGVGIVFQSFNLLPLLSVRENVVLPALMAGKNRRESLARAEELLERVGLEHRLHHESALLSGGEAQRVAVARALINGPALLLADEPTGNLDSQSAQDVLSALQAVARGEGRTVVMVTHSLEAARVADRVHEMRDGRFVS